MHLENFEIPSPLHLLSDPRLVAAGLQLYVKRDDLLHPEISGNKWRKLKYNLQRARETGKQGVLTFGGAFSNHIYATAAAGKWMNFPTIGIIRGERVTPLNPTLAFAESCGMKLHFVSRTQYRNKKAIPEALGLSTDQYYCLEEGGTNVYALPGCAEIVEEVAAQCNGQLPNYWCLSCGTGGTLAGLLTGLKDAEQVIGFSALKGDFHTQEIEHLLQQNQSPRFSNWQINTDYHFGGYAPFQPTLIDFMKRFAKAHDIRLDPVYTGKLFYGIFDLVEKGFFPRGSSLLAIHTGGLQGIEGFVQRFGVDL